MHSATDQHSSIRIFIGYARPDRRHHERLRTHLAILRQQGSITSWSINEILPGTRWDDEARKALDEADVIVLLISADFFDSEYWTTEMQRALVRHDAGAAHVVPVLASAVDWRGSPLAKLRVLPDNGVAVKSWTDRDRAWTNVAAGIRRVIESW